MTPIPDFGSSGLNQSGGIFFTPSNTAIQNYLYLQVAGVTEAASDFVFTFEPKNAESYLLLYTFSGCGELEYMDRKYTVGPGNGFLIDARQGFSYRNAGEQSWDFIWFKLAGNTFGVYYTQFASARKPVFKVTDGSELDEQLNRLAKISAQKSRPQSELLASTAIICILTQLVLKAGDANADKRTMPGYIEGIMERINSGYAGHISLDALAAEFNVSKFHLSREFKKYTGYSPNEYLISVRINRAKELLRRTGYSVGEISQMTGCGDVNHFIQLFKSREKTTPAAFRKHWQDG